MPELLVILGVVLVVAAIGAAIWWWGPSLLRSMRSAAVEAREKQAKDDFRKGREKLEAQFFAAAGKRGIPRGLAWVRCDFADDYVFAREKTTRELLALVLVTIGFEAIEGGGMEEVEAVSRLRAATALFRFRDGAWSTDGRALMNLEPREAIEHLKDEIEGVE